MKCPMCKRTEHEVNFRSLKNDYTRCMCCGWKWQPTTKPHIEKKPYGWTVTFAAHQWSETTRTHNSKAKTFVDRLNA